MRTACVVRYHNTVLIANASLGCLPFSQVLLNPSYMKLLRPSEELSHHPIILDPANPLNNVAAAVADLSTLQQLAEKELDKINSDRIFRMEQQMQQIQQQSELMSSAQALMLASTTTSLSFNVQVSALGGENSVKVHGPVGLAHGIMAEVWTAPYTGSQNGLLGFKLHPVLPTDAGEEQHKVALLMQHGFRMSCSKLDILCKPNDNYGYYYQERTLNLVSYPPPQGGWEQSTAVYHAAQPQQPL